MKKPELFENLEDDEIRYAKAEAILYGEETEIKIPSGLESHGKEGYAKDDQEVPTKTITFKEFLHRIGFKNNEYKK